MSKVIASFSFRSGTPTPRWSRDADFFSLLDASYGGLALRQGKHFGATCASAVLGPDLCLIGSQSHRNTPTAMGPVWSTTSHGKPAITFRQDKTFVWKRGHLINGRWGGPGNLWSNLTPLTSTANANHRTVEGLMDQFLQLCQNYEDSAHQYQWYGIYYAVRCSAAPFSDPTITNDFNLYSYAPAFLKVYWRAITITKPIPCALGTPLPPPVSAITLPTALNPTGLGLPTGTLPAGNAAGGLLLGTLPPGFPAAAANGFDGEVEIHQT